MFSSRVSRIELITSEEVWSQEVWSQKKDIHGLSRLVSTQTCARSSFTSTALTQIHGEHWSAFQMLILTWPIQCWTVLIVIDFSEFKIIRIVLNYTSLIIKNMCIYFDFPFQTTNFSLSLIKYVTCLLHSTIRKIFIETKFFVPQVYQWWWKVADAAWYLN